jgi:hypothetical protein
VTILSDERRLAGVVCLPGRPMLADRLLARSPGRHPGVPSRRGCGGDDAPAGGAREAWPLGLLEVLLAFTGVGVYVEPARVSHV